MKKQDLYRFVTTYFEEIMPKAETELNYNNPFQLLIAVILSAQCTDKRINQITPKLFNDFPTPEVLASTAPEVVYEYIKSVSYPNNKAKHLASLARQIVERFGGEVPKDPDDLQSLSGVGRKTANVVGAVLWGREVMPVDTHVFRVAARIGLSRNARTPLATERQLERGFPKELLPLAHHWLILHGRYTCTARAPKCRECGLTTICRHYQESQKQKL